MSKKPSKKRIIVGIIIIILSYACTPAAIWLAFIKKFTIAIIVYAIGWAGLGIGTFITAKEVYKKFKKRLKPW